MTHPFHPWFGQEFVLVDVRRNWAEDQVFFLDADGVQYSLPVAWTDAVVPDVFVVMAGGRSPFRVADLLALVQLVEAAAGGDV